MRFFLGKESKNLINGAIIGAIKNSSEIKMLLDYYRNITIYQAVPIPVIITKQLSENRSTDIKIFEEDFFYPFPYLQSYTYNNEPAKFITANTYAIHLWHKSWKIDYQKYVQVNNFIGALNALIKLMYQNPSSYKLWRRFPGTLKKAVKQYAKI